MCTTTPCWSTTMPGGPQPPPAFRGCVAAWWSTAGLPIPSRRPSAIPGARHPKLMRASPMRDHLWGFTMQGEDLPQRGNCVDLDPDVRDARGFPVARVTYKPHRHELAASDHHGQKLLEVLRVMGANWSGTATSPSLRTDTQWHDDRTSIVPASRHVMGTTRMGDDPATSVVDRYGAMHALPNVVVADSSVFVTSAGYGPTLTLVALAMRAAGALTG